MPHVFEKRGLIRGVRDYLDVFANFDMMRKYHVSNAQQIALEN